MARRTEAKSYAELRKFNPYHDARGRFSTANGSASFTYAPGKSKAHDLAIAREKERQAKLDAEAKAKAETKAKAALGNTESQKDHKKGTYNGYEAVELITEELGVTEKEATKMYKAVQGYSGTDYKDIRKFQQKGPPPDKSKESEALDEFVKKSPKWDGGTLYRGISLFNKKELDEILEDCKAGKPLSQKGSSSWSSSMDTANNFASGGTYEVVFKTKGKQNGTSIRHFSKFWSEQEVLMNSKAKWKPTNVTQIGNRYEIECEPIL